MSAPVPVPKWTVEQVAAFIESINLSHLAPTFRENAVNGSDLLELSDTDFLESLKCTPLQMKKIKKELEAFGVPNQQTTTEQKPGTPAPTGAALPPAQVSQPVPAVAPAAGNVQEEIKQLSARAAEAQRGVQAYSTAQQHLRRAQEELGRALSSLSVAQISGATETFQDMRIGMRGGGAFGRHRGMGRAIDHRNDMGHDMIEMATIHKANAMIKAAAQEIQIAKQAVPQMPFIKPANVQQAMGGVFINMIGGGLMTDMMQNAKVKQAKSQVAEMKTEVTQALDWCTNSMNAAQAEYSQLQGAIQVKQAR